MQRWEIKRIWMPLGISFKELSNSLMSAYPAWNDETRNSWAQVEALAAEGWELISAIAETASRGTIYGVGGTCCSFTSGYMLFFKGPKA